MQIHIHVHHHYAKEDLMTLQADVQNLVDQIAANRSATQSAIQAQHMQGDQIAALEAQVAELKAGAPIDAEDLAAIQASVATLKETNAALAEAVPANVQTT